MTGCAGAGTSLRGNLKGTGTLIMMSRHLRDPADFSVSLFLIIFDDFFMRRIIDDKILNYDLGYCAVEIGIERPHSFSLS